MFNCFSCFLLIWLNNNTEYLSTSATSTINWGLYFRNEGHIVGNHAYAHMDMSKIRSKMDFEKELMKWEKLYEEVTGSKSLKYYRPPEGKFTELNLKFAKTLGYKTFLWSMTYKDWYNNKESNKKTALSLLLSRTHPGAIVMIHS